MLNTVLYCENCGRKLILKRVRLHNSLGIFDYNTGKIRPGVVIGVYQCPRLFCRIFGASYKHEVTTDGKINHTIIGDI